ncbi:MAG: DUF711 family protein [Promethearchaeati archaeon]
MKIRAITIGANIPFLMEDEDLRDALEEKLIKFRRLNEDLTEEFKNIDSDVQSRRICSQPLFSYADQTFYKENLKETLQRLRIQFEIIRDLFKQYNIDYFSCCSMLADKLENFGVFEKLLLNEIPEYLKKFDYLFSSINVASNNNGINISALKSSAKIIKNLSSDPFKNLNFCVSSNVIPESNVPFFPASYHSSDKPGFGLALEMADEVIKITEEIKNISEFKEKLEKKYKEIHNSLFKISEKLATRHDIRFKGIDLSPAPFPELNKSIGTAIEKLGFEYFGSHGSSFAVALIKNSIPQDLKKTIGFSGFMQPVFEDYTISKRLSEGKFNLDTLLLYSCLCGTGLDCIPLPGSITERELFYILLDICTISLKFNKPLTARLMPIPGKEAGDEVQFDFEYFSPTKVIDYKRLTEDYKNDFYNKKDIFIKF